MRSQTHRYVSQVSATSILVVATFVVGYSLSTHAQSAPPSVARPSFEVASIKRNKLPNARAQIRLQPDGRFTASGVLARDLIRAAYRLWSPALIVDAPRWLSTDRFDIEAVGDGSESSPGNGVLFDATAPAPTGARQDGGRGIAAGSDAQYPRLMAMVQSLLEERFRLRVHTEMRELPTYSLELSRRDKRLGDSLRPSTIDCARPAASDAGAPCGISGAPGKYVGRGSTMFDLALMLTNFPAVGRLVFDRTGLTERYDWTLEWTPAFINAPAGAGATVTNPRADTGLSLFGALQEQLGLSMKGETGPVDVLVIDAVEPPTEN